MSKTVDEVKEIIDRETKAWDTKNVDLLLSIFHPDMIWVWPKDNKSYDPVDWKLPLGKFNKDRWWKNYSEMFEKYDLIKNDRKIVDIKISDQEDGAFAVVDVDTLWRNRDGEEIHWLGRAGKTYVKSDGVWKMIAHHGLLISDKI